MPALVVLLLFAFSSLSQAAPGEIAQAPVSQSTGVKPNIMLLLDDSGSMEWEDTLNEGVDDLGLVPSESVVGDVYAETGDCTRTFLWFCVERADSPAVIDAPYADLATCRGFNVLAYDPSVDYVPWLGRGDASLSNMGGLYYYPWNDEGDGEFDPGECDGPSVSFSSLSDEEKQNYANWFRYYRSRMMVSQAALFNLVGTLDGRLGFNTIHDRQYVSIDDLSDSHRSSLFSSVEGSSPNGGTPLRNALKRTGEMFAGRGGWNRPSPILSEDEGGMCQQNYTVLMSDGYWNGNSPSVGNVDAGSNALIRESDKDSVSDTMADVAMKYYLEDLSADLDDLVPVIPGVDENQAQHLVTYTIGFGVNGTLDSNPTNPDASFPWPNEPMAGTAKAVDDMRHAAWNSRGKFLSAANPVELLAAFEDIAGDISARSVSTGSLAISRFETGDDNVILQTQYDPATWEGDVLSRRFNEDGSLQDPDWTFASQLQATNYSGRKVYTYNPDGSEGTKAFDFVNSNWRQNDDPVNRFSQTQKRDLRKGFRQGGGQRYPDISRADFINYFRADDQHEGTLRTRENPFLGDIINSSPVIVGVPDDRYPDSIAGDSYASYRQAAMERDPIAYVGANDGMLHAIDMSDGSEKFAFIPHGVFSEEPGRGLYLLAENDYVHRYYVDGTPVARDAYVDLGNGSAWHTLLLGGLGGGGKSVYMLDVTDPGDFGTASNVVKWEFSHPNLGYTFSDVEVAKLANGDWYAIFGNGYNADEGTGQASLFMVNLENEDDFLQINTEIGSRLSGKSCTFTADDGSVSSDCNGLSSPEIADLDGDGVYDWAYAGDLHGNVWAFDLTDFDGSAGSVSKLRLFESCAAPSSSTDYSTCPVENRQPISTRVAVARNPNFSGSKQSPYLNVYWGTGQMLTASDASDKSPQTFYSVLHTGNEPPQESEPAYFHDDLQEQAFVQPSDADGNRINARYASGSAVDYLDANPDPIPDSDLKNDTPQRHGWYIDLPDNGERLVKRPVIAGDLVAFNTAVPGVGGMCEAASRGWLNALSLANGLPPGRNRGDYDVTSGKNQVFDYNGDGKFTAADLIEQQVTGDDIEGGEVVVSIQIGGEPTAPEFIGDNQYIGVTNGNGQGDGVLVQKTQTGTEITPGRTSWYQVR